MCITICISKVPFLRFLVEVFLPGLDMYGSRLRRHVSAGWQRLARPLGKKHAVAEILKYDLMGFATDAFGKFLESGSIRGRRILVPLQSTPGRYLWIVNPDGPVDTAYGDGTAYCRISHNFGICMSMTDQGVPSPGPKGDLSEIWCSNSTISDSRCHAGHPGRRCSAYNTVAAAGDSD